MSKGDKAIRGLTAATVIGVAGVAAFVSYRHAYEVATAHGEPGATATLLPGTIDGLVFVASMVMLDSARRGQNAPGLAKFALTLGIGSTVAVNVLHGIAHGPIGAVIAAWPAVTLVVVVELLMGMIRRGKVEPEPEPVPAPEPAPVVIPEPVPEVQPAEPVRVESAVPEPVQEVSVPIPALVPDHVLSDARDCFAEVLSSGEVPSVRAIRREMHVGHPKAVGIKDALAGQAR